MTYERGLWIISLNQELILPLGFKMPSPIQQWIISCLSYWFVCKEECTQICNVMFLKHSDAFRFFLSRSWVVFGHEGRVWVSQHKSMPFGLTSAVCGWHRVGCLLCDNMVSIFLAPYCRYVDDFFGVDPVGCEHTGAFASLKCAVCWVSPPTRRKTLTMPQIWQSSLPWWWLIRKSKRLLRW